MARVSNEVMEEFNKRVIAAVRELYDLGLISHKITNQDIESIEKKYSLERPARILRSNSVGRGVWSIRQFLPKGSVSNEVVANKTERLQVNSGGSIGVISPQTERLQVKSQISEVSFNTQAFIPPKDPDFVQWGHFKDIEKVVSANIFFPVYISGMSGNGKSTMVEQVHNKLNKPMIRMNITAQTDEDQLIGCKTLINGNIEIIEGPVVMCMRHGMTLMLDEISAANPNTIMCLQGVLEGKPYYFKLKNEIITPAKGFNIIVTDNTKGQGSADGRYIGTNVLNDAFLERYAIHFEQEYPDRAVEEAIAKQKMVSLGCYNENLCSNLVNWCMSIRMTFEQGALSDLISTRRLGHIIKAYYVYGNIEKAITLGVSRFDDQTKTAFVKLWEKMNDKSVDVPKSNLV